MYDLRCAKECWNTAFLLLLHKRAVICFGYHSKIERSPAHCSRRDALSAAYPAEKTNDLLSYEWVESTQGPPRKYYSLTPQGETFLSGLEAAWEELANTVNHLKNN